MQTGSLELLTKIPEEKDLYILTEFFKMLGNPTRIHILLLLMEQDGCVSRAAWNDAVRRVPPVKFIKV